MAATTPEMIKELRERTGVGIGQCKKALDEANGDIELAIANLRKSGMASAVKKEGRETKEGVIGVAQAGEIIALVEVNAETDFVARNDRFKEFLDNIANEVAKTNPSSLDAFLKQAYSKDPALTIDQYRSTVIQAIGENIQIRRLVTFKKQSDRSFGVYSHMNGKLVTVVEINGSDALESLAKDIAMHIAAASPEFVSPDQVPQAIIENEKEIALVQVKGKPANIIDKIIEGKLTAYYEANCLLFQKYIRNDSLTVGALVEQHAKEISKPIQVVSFIRWSVGH